MCTCAKLLPYAPMRRSGSPSPNQFRFFLRQEPSGGFFIIPQSATFPIYRADRHHRGSSSNRGLQSAMLCHVWVFVRVLESKCKREKGQTKWELKREFPLSQPWSEATWLGLGPLKDICQPGVDSWCYPWYFYGDPNIAANKWCCPCLHGPCSFFVHWRMMEQEEAWRQVAVETHSMNLSMHRSWANLKANMKFRVL